MHKNTHFGTHPKIKKKSWEGQWPLPRPLPNGERDTPLHTHPYSAPATPQFARLWRSTCPQTEILDPPLSDADRPDVAPIHMTVKPTIHVDGRPTDGQYLRMCCVNNRLSFMQIVPDIIDGFFQDYGEKVG